MIYNFLNSNKLYINIICVIYMYKIWVYGEVVIGYSMNFWYKLM